MYIARVKIALLLWNVKIENLQKKEIGSRKCLCLDPKA